MDFLAEYLGIVPNWRRRQLLLLDELIHIRYGTEELWYDKV